jgi:CheY-like chemotaxis protein
MLMKVSNIIIDNIEKKNQKLNVNMAKDLDLNYIADDLRLSQVVTNLLTNAIKFTPENGNITLAVEKTGSKGNDNTLRFTVTDTGIGMTEEQTARLFNAFEQADGSISHKFGGTGLGLAISKNIIEKMGGRIWVESKQGAGSSFIFEVDLERAPGQEGPERKSLEIETGTAVETPDLSGVSIILAEDMEINREIFTALLEETHITIDSAENGLVAVAKFRESPEKYDLIVMDVQMPEMDGYQATRTIRAMDMPKAKSIPIIAMTANAFKEDIDRCLEAGMNDHLAKPIDEKSVLEKLTRYSGRTNSSSKPKQEPLPAELVDTAWQG